MPEAGKHSGPFLLYEKTARERERERDRKREKEERYRNETVKLTLSRGLFKEYDSQLHFFFMDNAEN